MPSNSDVIRSLRAQIAHIESTQLDFTQSEAAPKEPLRTKKDTLHQVRAELAQLESSFSKQEQIEACTLSLLDDSQDAPTEGLTAEAAFQRIVRWTEKRFRSERDIRRRLIKEGYPEESCDSAVQRAKNCLLIDDERFADILIRSRVRQGRGSAGIEFELRQEGIDPQSVYGWPEDYLDSSEASELQRALAFLDTKTIRAKDIRGAAYRRLVQKGYSSAIATTAAKQWCADKQSFSQLRSDYSQF